MISFQSRANLVSILKTEDLKACERLFISGLEIEEPDYKLKMLESWEEMPKYFITSSSNGTGRDEVLNYISEINSLMSKKD